MGIWGKDLSPEMCQFKTVHEYNAKRANQHNLGTRAIVSSVFSPTEGAASCVLANNGALFSSVIKDTVISFKVVTYYKLNVSHIVCMFNIMRDFVCTQS